MAGELLPLLAGGDHRAAHGLYERYGARIRGLGLRLVWYDTRFADDLVQETMTRLWRMAERYDAGRGTEGAFVMTVARHVAIDLLRVARRSAPVALVDAEREGPADPDAHTRFDDVDAAGTVAGALARLHPDRRQVIELAYFSHLSQREIAERLGLPLGTVKTRTFHGLRELRALLLRDGFVR